MGSGSNEASLLRLSDVTLNSAALCTVIIAVVGVVGNSLTILALLKCPKIRNVASAFIVSLCIADLFFCLVVIPFSTTRFYYKKWIHGDFLCQVVPFVQYSNVGFSLLSIAMITVNRYIMIAHYQIYNSIYQPVWIGCMIVFCYILSFGMQVPTLLGVWGCFGLNKNLLSCSILQDGRGYSSKKFLFFMGFVVPCIVIVLCYTRIFMVVRSSEQRLRRHDTKELTKKEKKELKKKRNDMRITKMVLVIFLSFVFCYCPITVVKLVDGQVNYPLLHVIAYIFLYLSACINPIIYVIMNKQYRVAYKSVLMCKESSVISSIRKSVTQSRADKNEIKSEENRLNQDDSRTMFTTVPIALANQHEPEPASDLHPNLESHDGSSTTRV